MRTPFVRFSTGVDASGSARMRRQSQFLTLTAAVALALLAIALRVPFVRQIGPLEGGGDEWWSVWRTWSVLFEGGLPGNYLHPALYYDVGALWFRLTSGSDALADFVTHQYEYVRRLEYLSALLGGATVGVVFLLATRLFGSFAGVVAAASLTVLPLHVLYSQAARVDALFALCCASFWLALQQVEEKARLRDSLGAGVLLGLAISANYPGALLALPFLAQHFFGRRWKALVAGSLSALTAFLLTNPAVFLESAAFREGFLFQAGMAAHAHPGRESIGVEFYPEVLRQQGLLLVGFSLLATGWFLIRGPRFPRLLAASALGYVLVFAFLRTQFDRYILPPLPWLCVLVGGMLQAWAGKATVRRILVVGLAFAIVAEGAWLGRLRLRPDWRRVDPMPAEVAQAWLVEHTVSGERVWLDADVLPLMQAVFADPGGPLHDALQGAFQRAYPRFRATFLKGEHIEGSANFKPALLNEVRFAIACDGAIDQSQGWQTEEQRTFYAELRKCPPVASFDEQCRIRECGAR